VSRGPSRIGCTIDLGARGAQWGRLRVPFSRHESAYGHIPIPIASVVGGPGPTVLLLGGVHGDEYEGQIELIRLANTLDPAAVRGRVIVVPSANYPAAVAGRRTSPIDGGNLARLFPGERSGAITAMIAFHIEEVLLPLADALLDIHAGGSSLDYTPCVLARDDGGAPPAHLLAYGAPLAVLVAAGGTGKASGAPADDRTTVAAAGRRGIPALAPEMGGAGTTQPATHAITRRGIRNMLAHWGVLDAAAAEPAPSRLVRVEPDHHVFAPVRGVFEPAFDLGDRLETGAIAGRIWDIEAPERPPVEVAVPRGGLVIARRVPARVEPGDCLAQLAEDAG
jgi:predicted deacylase